MTVDDLPPTRRARRERESQSASERTSDPAAPVALAWVDDAALTPRPSETPEYVGVDLLARRPRRRALRAGTVLPVVITAGVAGLYAASTLLWPLYAVEPTVTAADIADVSAPASALSWPSEGAAAVAVRGFDSLAVSSDLVAPMASVTKLVTTLMVLEQSPIAPGEPGPTFTFSWADDDSYWEFLARDESALEMPEGESLTQYQMLQGVLIGSAGNYAERLARTYWPNDDAFARAAADWLQRNGLGGITVIEPTGIDEANRADAASLIALSRLAMATPVVAEIVRMPSVELPGVGLVENTNDLLLSDPQIVGIKTGSLDEEFTLTAAREFTAGALPLLAYAAVIGQTDSDARFSETGRLLVDVAAEASMPHALPAGTKVGTVTTLWGASSDILTTTDAPVVLWNGATAPVAVSLTLGDARTAGETVGEVRVSGPMDSATSAAQLTADLPGPGRWWRLTHPLQLWGLAD